ncbi:LysR substrate-binding domain-containing protein [Cellulomonas fimi]|uniref:LysR family transcriptional regulator n=1 Tax=Cellulomonas fimi TaxID=1708 RepID=A0A7Y0QHX5_CELFI|nr:LysR substrate-binding domain-containing protein [Cellulomonas fimi]NMR21646.1 LysR family transcriptional regulator [Cellulomonas fimi]
MGIDPARLAYFVAVAERLHFGRAAAELGIDRRALSRAVVELEAELGVALFVRPAGTTRLTDAGRDLLARAHEDLASTAPAVPTGTGSEPGPGVAAGAPTPAHAFRIGIAPGVVVSKWTRLWGERRPDVEAQVIPTDAAMQVTALHEGLLDVSFVRLPVPAEGLSVIPLYSEVPVVVLPRDHPLADAESLSVVELAEEHLLQDPATVPEWSAAADVLRSTPVRPPPETASAADAVALVAAGIGVLVVPKSVARLHHRKDVTHVPLTDVAQTDVGLAWLADRTTPDVEDFIGIVRGRSVTSSRSGSGPGSQRGARGGAPAEPTGRKSAAQPDGSRAGGRARGPAARRRPRRAR